VRTLASLKASRCNSRKVGTDLDENGTAADKKKRRPHAAPPARHRAIGVRAGVQVRRENATAAQAAHQTATCHNPIQLAENMTDFGRSDELAAVHRRIALHVRSRRSRAVSTVCRKVAIRWDPQRRSVARDDSRAAVMPSSRPLPVERVTKKKKRSLAASHIGSEQTSPIVIAPPNKVDRSRGRTNISTMMRTETVPGEERSDGQTGYERSVSKDHHVEDEERQNSLRGPACRAGSDDGCVARHVENHLPTTRSSGSHKLAVDEVGDAAEDRPIERHRRRKIAELPAATMSMRAFAHNAMARTKTIIPP